MLLMWIRGIACRSTQTNTWTTCMDLVECLCISYVNSHLHTLPSPLLHLWVFGALGLWGSGSLGPKSVSGLLVVALETVLPCKGARAAPSRQLRVG